MFVDGQPIGALKGGEGTFMVTSGPHVVTVKAVGYADMESQVVVKPTGAPTEVALTMIAQGERTPLNPKRLAGFGAVGVGVVFGIVGIASAVQVNSVQGTVNTVRTGQPASADVCSSGFMSGYTGGAVSASALSNACSKGKTFQTLQIVSFPLAAVAGGLGIFLIATSGKSAPKTTGGFTVTPQVGPGLDKVDLAYTW